MHTKLDLYLYISFNLLKKS